MQLANVVDDDGVLVLASAGRLRARFADREFDYEFPNELLAGAAAEELCAWQTNEPGDVTFTVHVDGPAPPEASYLGVLSLEAGDELLVLPYSQYTMACDYQRGVPENIEGLCTRLKVTPDRYACWARLAPTAAAVEPWAPLAFDIFLWPAGPAERPLSEVPVLER